MSKGNSHSGTSVSGLLLVLFIALKLLGKIEWSWFWVLAPGWMPLLLGALFFFFAFTVYFLKGKRL